MCKIVIKIIEKPNNKKPIRCRDCNNSTPCYLGTSKYYFCSENKGYFPARSIFEECTNYKPKKKEGIL